MSEVLATVLLTAMTIVVVGGFGVTVLSGVTTTKDPATAAFSLDVAINRTDPSTGAEYAIVTLVAGTSFPLEDARLVVVKNASDIRGNYSLMDDTAGSWRQGERLYVNISGASLRAGDRVTFMAVDQATNQAIGRTIVTLVDTSTPLPFLANTVSFSGFDVTPSPLTADGKTLATLAINVTATYGLDIVSSVTVDLRPVGGAADVALTDTGAGGDATPSDGRFAAQFVVSNFTFSTIPGTAMPQLNVTAVDITGKRWTYSAGRVNLSSPPEEKVAQGATYRSIISSASVNSSALAYVRFTNFTSRDASLLDNDQLQFRVADLADPALTWTVLVNFGYSGACGGVAGVTSVAMSIDGVTGRDGSTKATWTAPAGCMSMGANARLNLAQLNESTNAAGAKGAWSVTGDWQKFSYQWAGISDLNEGTVLFLGDGVSNVPSQTGISSADFQWGVLAGTSAPGAPSVSATRGNTFIDLSWSAPSDGGSPITNYNIYMGTTSGALSSLATIGTNTTYRAAGLTNGVTYYFQVAAVNALGEGTKSAEVSATPATLPDAPQNLALVSGDAHVNLSWDAPASDGGSAVTNYNIYVNTVNSTGTLLATIGTNRTYQAAGLTNGVTYYFQVQAVNAIGGGPRTSNKDATPASAPAAPQSLSATSGDAQVSLSWSAPSSDGGSAIINYRIYRGTTSGSLALLATIGTNTSYVDAAGLANGVTYYYHVSAVNALGEGAKTSEVSATPATTPSAPQGLAASGGDSQVSLSWSAPASTGGSAITNYRIYRGTTSGSLALLATIGTNTSYVDFAGLTNGVTYYYQVSAVNSAGEGAKTSEVSATPAAGATVPGAPQGLTATPGNVHVNLSWSAPASDGGSPLLSYKIYRGTSPGAATLLYATTLTNTTYQDLNVVNGQTYYYQVSAVNLVGEGSKTSEVSATPRTTSSAPQNLAASGGNASVSLSWTVPASDGGSAITNYRIYRGTTSGSLALLATIGTNTSYVDSAGLTNGVTYYYAVSAVNAAGEGARSAEASATPRTSPSAPQSLAASPGDRQVSLSWSAPASDGGSPITSYRIYRGTTSGSLALLATIGTNVSYVDSAGLTNGVTYYYAVSAVNGAGEGASSSEASATPRTTPGAPQSLSATGGNAQVSLSWTAPSTDGGSAITNYRIYRGTTSGSLALLATIGTNTTYVDSGGLVNGVTYHYAVSAVNAAGEGAKSAEASATPRTTPGAPQALAATAGNAQVSLSWSAPSSDGGSAITSYRIYRGTASGLHAVLATIGTNTTFVDATAANGVTYYYAVSAINAAGEGAKSSEVSATPRTTPGAPQGLSATGGNAQVSLAWSAPASDGGSAITSYRIYRGTASGVHVLLATIGTNTTYVDATVSNGVTYYYAVSAVNAAGEGPKSTEASATPATTPTAPQSLSATGGNAQVSLAWTAPSSNGGSSVTSYKIYRGTTSGSHALLATIGTNTSYLDATAVNGVTYYYAVSAVNAVGEGPKSAEASATPATTPSQPQNLAATGGNASVSLTWSAPSSNGGSSITSYRIYRGTTSGSHALLATIGTNTSYADLTVVNGVTYYYAVSAVNSVGEGSKSAEASATPATVPNPPASFTATAGTGQVSLSWSSGGSGGSAITNYQIHRGTTSGSLSLLATIGTNTTYTDLAVVGGTTYYYHVRAVNAIGTSNPSSEQSATPAASGTAPSAPRNLTASPANSQVGLNWTWPSSNGTSALTNYKIYRGTTSGVHTLLATIGTNLTYVDKTAVNGTTYYYAVTAVSSAGESPKSNEATATPSAAVSVDCSSSTTTAGTISSCNDLQFADLVYATLTESSGSGKTFDATFSLNVTGVTGTQTIEINGYRGNGPEDMHVQAWNVTTGSWETVATLLSSYTTATTFSGSVNSTHHWPAGVFRIRLIDAGPDPNNSSWNVDYVRLVTK